MEENEIVKISVTYVNEPGALLSVTASVAGSGGYVQYVLYDGWFEADVDKTTARAICDHRLVVNATELLPALPL